VAAGRPAADTGCRGRGRGRPPPPIALVVAEPPADDEAWDLERRTAEAVLADPLRWGEREIERWQERRRAAEEALLAAWERTATPAQPPYRTREAGWRVWGEPSPDGLHVWLDGDDAAAHAQVRIVRAGDGRVGHVALAAPTAAASLAGPSGRCCTAPPAWRSTSTPSTPCRSPRTTTRSASRRWRPAGGCGGAWPWSATRVGTGPRRRRGGEAEADRGAGAAAVAPPVAGRSTGRLEGCRPLESLPPRRPSTPGSQAARQRRPVARARSSSSPPGSPSGPSPRHGSRTRWLRDWLPLASRLSAAAIDAVPLSLTALSAALLAHGRRVARLERAAQGRRHRWVWVAVAVLTLGPAFEWAWGMAYRRSPLEVRLGLPTEARTRPRCGRRSTACRSSRAPTRPATSHAWLGARRGGRARWPPAAPASPRSTPTSAGGSVPLRLPATVRQLPAGTLLSGGFGGVQAPWWREPHVDGGLPPATALATGPARGGACGRLGGRGGDRRPRHAGGSGLRRRGRPLRDGASRPAAGAGRTAAAARPARTDGPSPHAGHRYRRRPRRLGRGGRRGPGAPAGRPSSVRPRPPTASTFAPTGSSRGWPTTGALRCCWRRRCNAAPRRPGRPGAARIAAAEGRRPRRDRRPPRRRLRGRATPPSGAWCRPRAPVARTGSPAPPRTRRRAGALRWKSVSTPSATTVRPRARPRATIARSSSRSAGSPGRSAAPSRCTKLTSILSASSGSSRRRAMLVSTRRSRRARDARRAPAGRPRGARANPRGRAPAPGPRGARTRATPAADRTASGRGSRARRDRRARGRPPPR
jgi:hypothetical protein